MNEEKRDEGVPGWLFIVMMVGAGIAGIVGAGIAGIFIAIGIGPSK